MYNLTTKEEVDFEYFKELLWNNEFQVINREMTEEEQAELSREIAKRRAMRKEASSSPNAATTEAVLA
jgi:transposase